MADIDDANTYNSTRGYTDWAALSSPVKVAALVRASDYILAQYGVTAPATGSEDARSSAARYIIARDLATNPTPLPIRVSPAVVKEAKEGAGFKKSVEYADAPTDPYPFVTAMLAPLSAGSSGVTFGRMVR